MEILFKLCYSSLSFIFFSMLVPEDVSGSKNYSVEYIIIRRIFPKLVYPLDDFVMDKLSWTKSKDGSLRVGKEEKKEREREREREMDVSFVRFY